MLIVALLLSSAAAASAQGSLTAKDLKLVEGEKWIGELTYLDYRSNKRTSIRSNLTVTKKSDSAWTFSYEYPDEPKADGSSDAELSADGKTFNGQAVAAKRKLPGGGLRFVTTKEGEDNNKKALFRYTYTVTPNTFSIKKEVRTEGTAEWFERNTYSWKRP